MSDERPGPEETTPDEGYSPDTLPILKIGLWIGGLAVVFIAATIGLYQFFVFQAQDEVYEKQLRPVAPAVVQARDREAALLGRYDEVEGKPGHYRVPIERAMQLIAADPKRLEPMGGK
ncbi:MAG TPA: hypothetical protein VGQ83_11305 [Polyangia bacterium]|jgi:hypothetical protein